MDAIRGGIAALLGAAVLSAQEPAGPKFDVVSIRPVPANAEPLNREIDFTPVLPGGRFIDARTALFFLISYAYDVKDPSRHLGGLPGWAKNQSYSVSARPADDFPKLSPKENSEQVRLMLRAMLADRFHLKVHSETRQEPVFSLELAKGGFKLKEVDPPVPPAKEGYVQLALSDSFVRMIGNKSTVSGIGNAASTWLGRTVVDRTGLKGYYDFEVNWKAQDTRAFTTTLGADGVGLLISVLQEQFGLRLSKATGTGEFWVVDHVEQPSGN